MSKKYTIQFVVGDWSDDGHGKTHTHTFKTNYPALDIMKAYTKSVETTGINIKYKYCHDYEEATIPKDTLSNYISADDVFSNGFSSSKPDHYWVTTEDWTHFYLHFCKISLPDLSWKEENISTLNIGGYGLLS